MTDNIKAATGYLRRLAGLYNVQTAYYDVQHRRRVASVESLVAVLRSLGAPIVTVRDSVNAFRERNQQLHRTIIEPVNVAWKGTRTSINITLPAPLSNAAVHGFLATEDGLRREWKWSAADLVFLRQDTVEGVDYLTGSLEMPEELPTGYHTLTIETAGTRAETTIISAPPRAYLPPGEGRDWGVFIPLYALRSRNGRAAGSYTDLAALSGRVAEWGGNIVATLPLLPCFLDEPFEPSPYSPISRLLWNEFYIDPAKVPEIADSPDNPLVNTSYKEQMDELRDLPLVDYHRLMKLQRSILESGLRNLLAKKGDRYAGFQSFLKEKKIVADYAAFRAVMERQGRAWPAWPGELREGTLGEGTYDENSYLYHAYSQWLAHEQVNAAMARAEARGVTIYCDLPVGTHPQGFDTWRERDSFALDNTAGAPPDTVFTRGQNWWFPPLHPEKMRAGGYRYFRDFVCHHLRSAGMLRIDHVMGLHRLFWIPRGMGAERGVYVGYRSEELYAVLALESQRHRCVIVGEDLGTVPPYVGPAMSRHGLRRMYVLHYELAGDSAGSVNRPRKNAVASLNTHDMPPFAAFWQDLDIPERKELGLLNEKSARTEDRARNRVRRILLRFLRGHGWISGNDNDAYDVFKACLNFLASSRAGAVLVNLEDLWRETKSQNVPSTGEEHPNWRRKARYALEEFSELPEVNAVLKEVNFLRRQGGR